MTRDRRPEADVQRLREIAHQVLDEEWIVGKIGCQDVLIQRNFAVRHQHGDLRPC